MYTIPVPLCEIVPLAPDSRHGQAKTPQGKEKAIDQGDVKAALEVLKRLQLFVPSPIGSDDPAELAAKAKRAKRHADNPMKAMMEEMEEAKRR